MTLALTLVLGTLALAAFFWGLSAVLQGYLYSQPADNLPVRAVVAGGLVALVLTGWTYANTRATHKDKYGTLFEFNPTAVTTLDQFDAVRQQGRVQGTKVEWLKDETGEPKRVTTGYKWLAGDKGGRFLDPDGKDFKLNDSSSVTVALEVPDGDGKKARFTTELADGVYRATAAEGAVFTEEGGRRTIGGANPRLMETPSTAAFALAVGLNVLNFVVWFVALWPVLRFGSGAALGLAAVFGSVTVLLLMPLLFDLNAVKARPPEAAQTAPTKAG